MNTTVLVWKYFGRYITAQNTPNFIASCTVCAYNGIFNKLFFVYNSNLTHTVCVCVWPSC